MNVTMPELPAKFHVQRPLKPLGKQFGTFDTLESRRDLFRLLERLDRMGEGEAPEIGCRRRREFFAWCCREAAQNSGMNVAVGPQTVGMAGEIYRDIVALCALPGYLDIEYVAKRLEQVVRRLR